MIIKRRHAERRDVHKEGVQRGTVPPPGELAAQQAAAGGRGAWIDAGRLGAWRLAPVWGRMCPRWR